MTDKLYIQIEEIVRGIRADEKSAVTEMYISQRIEYSKAMQSSLLRLGSLVYDNASAILSALKLAAVPRCPSCGSHDVESFTGSDDAQMYDCVRCGCRWENEKQRDNITFKLTERDPETQAMLDDLNSKIRELIEAGITIDDLPKYYDPYNSWGE